MSDSDKVYKGKAGVGICSGVSFDCVVISEKLFVEITD